MPLQASGAITMAEINAEFGRGNNLNAYRGKTYYTPNGSITASTFPSGSIAFSNFYNTRVVSAGTKVIFLLSGTSWTVPDDWNNSDNTIECIGGGISGQAGSASAYGGGGGSYAASTNVSLTPGASVTYAIGSGSGGDTCFGSSTIAGATVAAEGGDRPTGGRAPVSVGGTKYNGGSAQATTPVGSGGGGGAFYGGAGGNAPTTAGGIAAPGTRTSNPGSVSMTAGAGGAAGSIAGTAGTASRGSVGGAGSLRGGGGGKGSWGSTSPGPKAPSKSYVPYSTSGGAGAAGAIVIFYKPRAN